MKKTSRVAIFFEAKKIEKKVRIRKNHWKTVLSLLGICCFKMRGCLIGMHPWISLCLVEVICCSFLLYTAYFSLQMGGGQMIFFHYVALGQCLNTGNSNGR